jgi:hypothetical protein
MNLEVGETPPHQNIFVKKMILRYGYVNFTKGEATKRAGFCTAY